jgi:hypothetical protein
MDSDLSESEKAAKLLRPRAEMKGLRIGNKAGEALAAKEVFDREVDSKVKICRHTWDFQRPRRGDLNASTIILLLNIWKIKQAESKDGKAEKCN